MPPPAVEQPAIELNQVVVDREPDRQPLMEAHRGRQPEGPVTSTTRNPRTDPRLFDHQCRIWGTEKLACSCPQLQCDQPCCHCGDDFELSCCCAVVFVIVLVIVALAVYFTYAVSIPSQPPAV